MNSSICINPTYKEDAFKKLFREQFRFSGTESFVDDHGVQIHHEPFTCAVVPNFLNDTVVEDLEVEARKFPMNRQLNDLFSLHQSDDLLTLSKNPYLGKKFPLLKDLRAFFVRDLMNWMMDVTGAELDKDNVNSTISRYEPNDYLLCHDDELERRRIAFIIYLVPDNWDGSKDGGCLDMFESGPAPGLQCTKENPGDYHPWRVVRSLPPQRNCLAFFEVCSKSFHQVSEILGSKDRLSVHGWFMSDPLPRVRRCGDPLRVPRLPPCFVEIDLVYKWINPIYIDPDQQKSILRRFKAVSEIQLPQFFVPVEWEKLCKALSTIKDKVWLHEGPADLRNVSVLPYKTVDEKEGEMPEECRQVRRLLHSEAMLVLLSQMTGILLHPAAAAKPESDGEDDQAKDKGTEESGASAAKRPRLPADAATPSVDKPSELTASRFHRWCSGMYTMLADADSGVVKSISKSEDCDKLVWRLDLFYHIAGYGTRPIKGKTCQKEKQKTKKASALRDADCWQSTWNGQIIYISRNDNEELLRITPENNSLTLVYGDSDSVKFVRYLNAKAKPMPLLDSKSGGGDVDGVENVSTYAYDISLTYFDPSPNDGEADDDVSVVTMEETEDEEESDDEDGDE